MYKFVRIKDNRTKLEYPFMLLCENVDELVEHTEKYMSTEISKGIEDFMLHLTDKKHPTTNWSTAINELSQISEKPWYVNSINLENEVFQGKIKCLMKFDNIRDTGSYMTITSDVEIIETIEKEKMVYPKYSEKDIKITKWEGGKHYYASIGNMTVTDEDGNKKWNTEKTAMKYAKKYLAEI